MNMTTDDTAAVVVKRGLWLGWKQELRLGAKRLITWAKPGDQSDSRKDVATEKTLVQVAKLLQQVLSVA
jgi:hypothetical protein